MRQALLSLIFLILLPHVPLAQIDGAGAQQAHPLEIATWTQPREPLQVSFENTLDRKVRDIHANEPLYFIKNRGQIDERVGYYTHQGGANLYFTAQEVVLALPGADQSEQTVLRLRFLDANPRVNLVGVAEQTARFNYFVGSDPGRWRTAIPSYSQVVYRNLYRGVDLRYIGRNGLLKYEFLVQPGANAAAISLAYAGVETLHIADNGDLLVVPVGAAAEAVLRDSAPVVYQEIGGARVAVAATFALRADHTYGFEVGMYDPSYPLIIDPELSYSTFLGGSREDYGSSMTLDSAGNIYVTGKTSSSNFPTSAGTYNAILSGYSDAFVSVLDPTLGQLLYSTFLGGSDQEKSNAIILDGSDNVYVTGYTFSSDFATTAMAFDTSHNGGFDAFVSVLDSTLTELSYSTLLGGGDGEAGEAISLDGGGNACITGYTRSTDFPTSVDAYDRSLDVDGVSDAFVSVLNPALSSLSYSTFLGGSSSEYAYDVASDGEGNVYIVGSTYSSGFPTTGGAFDRSYNGGTNDVFVSVLDSTLSNLLHSTFLGASSRDEGYAMMLDDTDQVYVAGVTASSGFPVTIEAYDRSYNGGFDVFVSVLDSTLSIVSYSTFLGGSGNESGADLVVDGAGNVYVSGSTSSTNFPTTAGVYDQTFNGSSDAFVSVMDLLLSGVSHSTFLGGVSDDGCNTLALDDTGHLYVMGYTTSSEFPTTSDAYAQICSSCDDGWNDMFVSAFACLFPLSGVILSGLASGEIDETLTFVAEPQPGNASPSVDYIWSENGLIGGQGTTQASYRWSSVGTRMVQVTAHNCGGQDVNDSRFVTIRPPAPTLDPVENGDGDGDYVLVWNDIGDGTSYTLEEDTDPVFSSPSVSYTGLLTQSRVAEQPGGRWYYRVQASVSGTNSAWSNVESVDVMPLVPTLASPPDGTAINDTSPVLDWEPVPDDGGVGVAGYNVRLGTEIYTVTAALSEYTPWPMVDGIYTWTVRSYNNAGLYGPYAEGWRLIVDTQEPDLPVLVDPPDGKATNDTSPSLCWDPATDNGQAGVAGYRIRINTNVYTVTAPLTEYTSSLLADGVYTWTVQAYDYAGNKGSYAPERTLTLDTQGPNAPALASPPDGAATNETSPILKWEPMPADGGTGVVGYNVWISPNMYTVTAPTTEYIFSPLADGIYTWTVQAYDEAGNHGPYAIDRTVTVDTRPPVDVTITVPHRIAVPVVPVSWSAYDVVSGVVSFTVEYSGTLYTGWQSWLVGTTSIAADFAAEKDSVYLFRVTAHDRAGNASQSQAVTYVGPYRLYVPFILRY